MSRNLDYSSPAGKDITIATRAKQGCLVLGLLGSLTLGSSVAQAAPSDRILSLYNIHTKETLNITYKQAGKYDRKSLDKINWFMRDWRNNQTIKMDPKLLDLMWEVHQDLGSKKPIHVVSSYRSQKTNEMLRRKGRKVARNSQHTKGRAVDVYFPDISSKKLRENALIRELGGVGYYPRSLSRGFVHFDTGRVRHWPRMSATTFAKLFPNGKSKHVPRSYPSKSLYAKYRGKAPEPHIQMALASKSGRTPDVRANTNIQIASLSSNNTPPPTVSLKAKKPESKPSGTAPIVLTSAKILEEKTRPIATQKTPEKLVKPVELASVEQTKDPLNAPLASGLKPIVVSSNMDVKIIPASAELSEKPSKDENKAALVPQPQAKPDIVLASLSTETGQEPEAHNRTQKAESKLTSNKLPPVDIVFSKASLAVIPFKKNILPPRVNREEKGDLLMTTFYKNKKKLNPQTASLLTSQMGAKLNMALSISWDDNTKFSRFPSTHQS